MEDWFDSCPQPIIARVIEDAQDLHHMVTSKHIYQQGVLVTTTLDTLESLDGKKYSDCWRIYTFHVQYPCGYQVWQTKDLSEESAVSSAYTVHEGCTRVTLLHVQVLNSSNEVVLTPQELLKHKRFI